MILELDCGNTRIKWRVLPGEGLPPQHSGCAEGEGDLLLQLQGLAAVPFAWCRCVSVRSSEETNRLLAALSGRFPMRVLQASPATVCSGVSNGYRDVQRLGLDRWMAILGGYRLVGGACLILDLGSAITADLVGANGEHLGGYIAPGLPLMRTQLFTHTRRIRYDLAGTEMEHVDLRPGRSTAEAVERGCTLMLQGFVKVQGERAHELLGDAFQVLLTGGDAALAADILPRSRVVADLVFAGLALACPIERD